MLIMKELTRTIVFVYLFLISIFASAQELPFRQVKISVSPGIKSSFIKGGRLLLYLSREREREPRNHAEVIFGYTLNNWDGESPFTLDANDKEILHTDLAEGFIPVPKKFYYQAIYKQNIDDGQADIPGNIYSSVDSVEISGPADLKVMLKETLPHGYSYESSRDPDQVDNQKEIRSPAPQESQIQRHKRQERDPLRIPLPQTLKTMFKRTPK